MRRIGERVVPHAELALLGASAAADLEGFAHSAAAGPETADMKRRIVTERTSPNDWKSAVAILA